MTQPRSRVKVGTVGLLLLWAVGCAPALAMEVVERPTSGLP
jgi:hypothetical protein